MGKLIAFPVARLAVARGRRTRLRFDAFAEAQALQRAQLRLLVACCAVALLGVAALQLLSR